MPLSKAPALGTAWMVVALACGSGPDRSREPREVISLEEAFPGLHLLTLAEHEDDPIAELGAFLESRSSDLFIADGLQPRLRSFGADGRIKEALGRFGEGPGEFRSIAGLAEDRHGRLYLADPTVGRITVLDHGLNLERVIHPAGSPFGPIFPQDNGELLIGAITGREGNLLHMIDTDGRTRWSGFAPPEELSKPYWRSTSRILVAGSDRLVFIAASILYPIRMVDHAGRSVGNIEDPPPSFRRIPEVELGAFAGGPFGPRFEQWLASFTVIGGLHIVADDVLVVVHSTLDSDPRTVFQRKDYAIDVYRISDRVKLLEDVRLPPGSRVLGGGTHLHIQVSSPPQRWQLLRLPPPPA